MEWPDGTPVQQIIDELATAAGVNVTVLPPVPLSEQPHAEPDDCFGPDWYYATGYHCFHFYDDNVPCCWCKKVPG